MNEPSNAILKDFDDFLMDDVGHVVTNNDNNIVYNDQPYCYGNLTLFAGLNKLLI